MSNTPNNETPPDETPPHQIPSSQTLPDNNKPPTFNIQHIPESIRNILSHPWLIQIASQHPSITNIIVALFLAATGVNFIQNPGIVKENDLTQYPIKPKEICKTYKENEYPDIKNNEFIDINYKIKSSDSNSNRELILPTIECEYLLKTKDSTVESKKLQVKLDHDTANSSKELINKETICENFVKQIQDQNYLQSNRDVSLNKVSELSDQEKNNNEYLFSCEYTITKNDSTNTNKIIVGLRYLSSDFIKNNNSDEYKINVDEICKDPSIQKKHKDQIRKSPAENIQITSLGAKLLDKQDVWPVFRWVCEYEISERQRDGRIQIRKEGLGLSLDDDYCRKKYLDEKVTKASHHDYNNPYSLYCTRPDLK